MLDNLTGLPNVIGLLEWVEAASSRPAAPPFSLAAIHLAALWQVNRTQGAGAGDELLRHCAQTLNQAQPGRVFRSGGDKFVVFLAGANFSENTRQAQALAAAVQPGGAALPARLAVIHFEAEREFTPGNVLACLLVGLADAAHAGQAGAPVEFWAGAIQRMPAYPWMMLDLAGQLLRIGRAADHSLQLAYTDSISQLPNLRAGLQQMEELLSTARQRQEPFAVLLIDGDNLRQFNTVGYAAGDEAIRLIGAALQAQLRETDFLARFRSGDEFLLLLPDTAAAQALYVAQRLCWAVERASQAWLFHTTVSIGMALFPIQGSTAADLLLAAERALEAAKHQGKNQAVLQSEPIPVSVPKEIETGIGGACR